MHALVSIAGFSWACTGFAALSLAMSRHYQHVFAVAQQAASQALPLRFIGWCGLAVSLIACTALFGWAVGTTLWLGLLTVAAISNVLLLTYAPRWVARWGIATGAIGALCAIAIVLA